MKEIPASARSYFTIDWYLIQGGVNHSHLLIETGDTVSADSTDLVAREGLMKIHFKLFFKANNTTKSVLVMEFESTTL